MGKVTNLAAISAVAFTVLYIVATWFLFVQFVMDDAPTQRWERALVIYNPLVAVGFSAIGVLLGTRVEAVKTEQVKAVVRDAKKKVDMARGLQAPDEGDTGGSQGDRLAAASAQLDTALNL